VGIYSYALNDPADHN